METIKANELLTVLQNMNRFVALTSSEEVGIAKTSLVGLTQTVAVGKSKNEHIGEDFSLTVGEKLVITVGKSRLEMTKDGEVTLTGTRFDFRATGAVRINGKVIDLC